jgi:hypothetical protein
MSRMTVLYECYIDYYVHISVFFFNVLCAAQPLYGQVTSWTARVRVFLRRSFKMASG